MQALVFNPDLRDQVRFVADYPDPSPADGEVLVRVRRAGVCSTDLEIVKGYMGFQGVLGHEFVGDVAEGPPDLLGKRVVGEINCLPPGDHSDDHEARKHWPTRTVLGIAGRDGAFAEFVRLPAANCWVVPDPVSDQQAVFVEPLAAAAQIPLDHPIKPGMKVGLIGTGRLGLLVAQVLKLQGCDLYAYGRNPRTLALCERFGITAIESTAVRPHHDHDLVVDCTGSVDGLRLAFELVRPRGTIVIKSTYAEPPTIDLAPVVIHELTLAGNRCGPFGIALDLLQSGRVEVDPLVTHVAPLADGPAAIARAATPDQIKVQFSLIDS